MRRHYRSVVRFIREDDGPAAVEYAVMIALIVTVCIATISSLGINTKQVCDTICTVVYGKPSPSQGP